MWHLVTSLWHLWQHVCHGAIIIVLCCHGHQSCSVMYTCQVCWLWCGRHSPCNRAWWQLGWTLHTVTMSKDTALTIRTSSLVNLYFLHPLSKICFVSHHRHLIQWPVRYLKVHRKPQCSTLWSIHDFTCLIIMVNITGRWFIYIRKNIKMTHHITSYGYYDKIFTP